ncbi:MAG: AAA family ATPase [bacterium]|nr:AAA family ATPase [bacterium]
MLTKRQQKIRNIKNKILSITEMDSLEIPEPEDDDLERIPDPISWSEFSLKKFPEDRWYIEGLVPKYGSTILAAVSGERKSWLALQMTKSLISGEDFLGHFKVWPGNVLYIDGEMAESEFQRRGKQLQLIDKNFKMFLLNKGDIDLSSDSGIAYLRLFVKVFEISVVFIDTFREVAGGLKESQAEDVREFFNPFKPFKNEGVALIWLDHFRKPARWEGDVPKKEYLLGSQDKAAGCEVLLMLKTDDKTEEIGVYQTKNRVGAILKPFKIKMEDELVDSQKITKFSYLGEIEEKEQQKERAKELILNILKERGSYNKELVSAVYESSKIGSRNTQEALRDLIKAKTIDFVREGRKHYYFLPKEEEPEKDPEMGSLKQNDDVF